MTYRINDPEISADLPFRHDALDRQPLVEFLATLIKRLNGPFVMALDSPWGTGKTTLVRMLIAVLGGKGFQCLYFNAWKVDYVTDPIVALVSSIDRIELGADEASRSYRDHLKTVKKVTSLVAKRGLLAATKALTLGALDIEEEYEAVASELAADAVGDIVDAFNLETQLLEKFRTELQAAVAQLPAAGREPNLVIFVDELDRCRPSFAIELLERIKHLFDIPNIVFVLSVDKQQLEASTAAIYGSSINAAEYLRRFIDLEYGIPMTRSKQFTENLVKRFGLEPVFAQRIDSATAYDKRNFIEFFTLLADAVGLTLRARERCLTRLRVVLDQTPPDHYLDPVLVSLLIVLRSNNPVLFTNIVTGVASAETVMEYLMSLPKGKDLCDGRLGIAVHAFLAAADPNETRAEQRAQRWGQDAETDDLPAEARRRAKALLDYLGHLNGGMRGGIRLAPIAAKIDLAAMVRE